MSSLPRRPASALPRAPASSATSASGDRVERPRVVPESRAVEALLSDPWFSEKVGRLRSRGRGLELLDVPAAMDRLLDLNSIQLGTLAEALGEPCSRLRSQGRLGKGPLSAEAVLRILSGSFGGDGLQLPVTAAEARKFIADRSARLRSERDPSRKAKLQRELRELGLVERQLAGLKRNRGLQRFGFLVQGALNLRLFEFTGDDEELRAQGGLWALESGGPAARALSNHVAPGIGAGLVLRLTERNRRTGHRSLRPYVAFPAFSSMYGSVFLQASPTEKVQRGFAVGPANFMGVGYDPIFGRTVQVALPWKGSLCVSERSASLALYLGGKINRGLPIPGRARAVPSFGVGIEGDQVYHLTRPFITLAEKLESGFRMLWRKLSGTRDDGER